MSSLATLATTTGVLVSVIAGALLGMWLGHRLPERHRTPESREAVKLATGMLSVLAALVLGLLIASVKNAFDTTDTQIREFASTLILLHQTLADYGPETAEARAMLRTYTARALADNWPEDRDTPIEMEDLAAGELLDGVRSAILRLAGGSPQRDMLRADAAALIENALKTRLLLIERSESSIKPVFLQILIAWITLIFISFGYAAPRNATVATSFLLSAGALAACIFLIIEMDSPFAGLITVSSRPMRSALAHMTPQPEPMNQPP